MFSLLISIHCLSAFTTLPSLEDPARRKDTLPPESPTKTLRMLVSQQSAVTAWPRCSQDTLTLSGRPLRSSCSSHTTTRPWLEQKQTLWTTQATHNMQKKGDGEEGGSGHKGTFDWEFKSRKHLFASWRESYLVATATKSSSWGQHATWVIAPSWKRAHGELEIKQHWQIHTNTVNKYLFQHGGHSVTYYLMSEDEPLFPSLPLNQVQSSCWCA